MYILRRRTKIKKLFSHFVTTFHNFAHKTKTGCAARVVKLILETRYLNDLFLYLHTVYFSWHKLLNYCLKNQWFLNLNCILLIIKLAESLEILLYEPKGYSTIQHRWFGNRLPQHPETRLIILHGVISGP